MFATGTFQMEAHMGPPCADDKVHGVDCQVRKIMTNVLVTFGSGPAIPAKIFEADLETGTVASRTRTFTALGTYSYSCTNHPAP